MLTIERFDDTITVRVKGKIVWIGSMSEWSLAVVQASVRSTPMKVA